MCQNGHIPLSFSRSHIIQANGNTFLRPHINNRIFIFIYVEPSNLPFISICVYQQGNICCRQNAIAIQIACGRNFRRG